MNRLCVTIPGHGFVPVHTEPYSFETSRPKKIGEDALIWVAGKLEHVRLLRSAGMLKNTLYLVRV